MNATQNTIGHHSADSDFADLLAVQIEQDEAASPPRATRCPH